MPKILRCDHCGAEEMDNSSSLRGTDWLKKGLIGGMQILCPKCRVAQDEEDSVLEQVECEIAICLEAHERELRKKITPESVRSSRKELSDKIGRAWEDLKKKS